MARPIDAFFLQCIGDTVTVMLWHVTSMKAKGLETYETCDFGEPLLRHISV